MFTADDSMSCRRPTSSWTLLRSSLDSGSTRGSTAGATKAQGSRQGRAMGRQLQREFGGDPTAVLRGGMGAREMHVRMILGWIKGWTRVLGCATLETQCPKMKLEKGGSQIRASQKGGLKSSPACKAGARQRAQTQVTPWAMQGERTLGRQRMSGRMRGKWRRGVWLGQTQLQHGTGDYVGGSCILCCSRR